MRGLQVRKRRRRSPLRLNRVRQLSFVLVCLFSANCGGSGRLPSLPLADAVGTDTTQARAILKQLRSLHDSLPHAFDSVTSTLLVFVQMHLGQLGFGQGPLTGVRDAATTAFIEQFERARGLAVTGNPFSEATPCLPAQRDGEAAAVRARTKSNSENIWSKPMVEWLRFG